MGLPPPFWAFAWAGGQALARYIADHPEIVAGRRVLDFASGSGLVAIAAAKAGAAQVEASEIDPFALAAIAPQRRSQRRADLSCATADLVGRDEAGRSCSPATSPMSATWRRAVSRTGCTALARRGAAGADRRPRPLLSRARSARSLAEYAVPVTRELEDCEIKLTGVYRFRESRSAC